MPRLNLTKMPTVMAQEILPKMPLKRTMLMRARVKRLLSSLSLSRAMRLAMTPRTMKLRMTIAPPVAMLLALPMRETLSAEHNNLGVMLLDGTTGEEALAPTAGTGSFQPYQLRQMADRIGGGDAFAAGLLHARFGRPNRSLSEVAGFAIAAGCLKHSFAGDVNRATEAEIEQLMNGGNSRVCR